MHNEQPFYIGQKVVCVNDGCAFYDSKRYPTFKKDDVLYVEDIVDDDIKLCGHIDYWFKSRFKPIQRKDITASLAQDAVQERLDVVKVKEVEGV